MTDFESLPADGIRCVVVNADTSIEVKHVHDGLEDYQAIVDGYIEAVDFTWNGRRMSAYINEEGLIHGLPINPMLSLITGVPVLCGNGVIVGAPDSEGNTTDADSTFCSVMTTLAHAQDTRIKEHVLL
mgnify:CR=1 FL=1|tara:strand:+ start:1180 stop:1563 length:384 start_codon:yes stop_codon:yes gene_type:complete